MLDNNNDVDLGRGGSMNPSEQARLEIQGGLDEEERRRLARAEVSCSRRTA